MTLIAVIEHEAYFYCWKCNNWYSISNENNLQNIALCYFSFLKLDIDFMKQSNDCWLLYKAILTTITKYNSDFNKGLTNLYEKDLRVIVTLEMPHDYNLV